MPALSRLPALPSSSKTVAYPSRAGDSTLLKISLIHLMTGYPHGPTALLTKFLKTISKYSRREARIRFSCPIAMGYFRYYLLSIIYNLLLLTSYIFIVQLLRGRY